MRPAAFSCNTELYGETLWSVSWLALRLFAPGLVAVDTPLAATDAHDGCCELPLVTSDAIRFNHSSTCSLTLATSACSASTLPSAALAASCLLCLASSNLHFHSRKLCFLSCVSHFLPGQSRFLPCLLYFFQSLFGFLLASFASSHPSLASSLAFLASFYPSFAASQPLFAPSPSSFCFLSMVLSCVCIPLLTRSCACLSRCASFTSSPRAWVTALYPLSSSIRTLWIFPSCTEALT